MIRVDGCDASSVPVSDRGLNYGDGIFETIALIQGQPELWRYHWNRFVQSAEVMGLDLPDESFWLGEIKILSRQASSRAVLKLMLTGGDSSRGYRRYRQHSRTIAMLMPWPEYADENWQDGIHLGWCSTRLALQPLLAGIKHLNRLEQVMARGEWHNEFDEGIMLDVNGRIIEGTMSNIFMRVQGQWYTPMLNNCGIAGVVRQWVLDYWADKSLACVITDLYRHQLMSQADAAFITNSIIGIWPVRRILKRKLSLVTEVSELVQIIQQQR